MAKIFVQNTQKTVIKQNLIPEEITTAQVSIIYTGEADMLNVAIFGQTATLHGITRPPHHDHRYRQPIAYALDFEYPQYFSHLSKKQTGQTLQEFRVAQA